MVKLMVKLIRETVAGTPTRKAFPSRTPPCEQSMSRWFLVLAAAALCSTSCSVAGLQTTSFASCASPHTPRYAFALSRRGKDTAGVDL